MRCFSTQAELIEKLKSLKPQLETDWPIASMSLFGSWVRGEAGPESDVDLLVEFREEPSSPPLGLFELVNLKLALEDALGCKVDLVEPTALKPRLAARILPEARAV